MKMIRKTTIALALMLAPTVANAKCDATIAELSKVSYTLLQGAYICQPVLGDVPLITARASMRAALVAIGLSMDEAIIKENEADEYARQVASKYDARSLVGNAAGANDDDVAQACQRLINDTFRRHEILLAKVRSGQCG